MATLGAIAWHWRRVLLLWRLWTIAHWIQARCWRPKACQRAKQQAARAPSLVLPHAPWRSLGLSVAGRSYLADLSSIQTARKALRRAPSGQRPGRPLRTRACSTMEALSLIRCHYPTGRSFMLMQNVSDAVWAPETSERRDGSDDGGNAVDVGVIISGCRTHRCA